MGKHRNGNDNLDRHCAPRRVTASDSGGSGKHRQGADTHIVLSRQLSPVVRADVMEQSSRMAGSEPINQQFQEARTGTELMLRDEMSAPDSLPTSSGSWVL